MLMFKECPGYYRYSTRNTELKAGSAWPAPGGLPLPKDAQHTPHNGTALDTIHLTEAAPAAAAAALAQLHMSTERSTMNVCDGANHADSPVARG
jgi:hypothetical protein